jgi:hypothetical protein
VGGTMVMRICNIDDKTRIIIKRTGNVHRKIHFLWQTLVEDNWEPANGSFTLKAKKAEEMANLILKLK